MQLLSHFTAVRRFSTGHHACREAADREKALLEARLAERKRERERREKVRLSTSACTCHVPPAEGPESPAALCHTSVRIPAPVPE